MTTDAFETIAKGFDPPLVIVTTAAGDQRGGCIVGFHSQCSIDPLRYAVWLSKANLTYRVALLATHVAVHVPVAGDKELVELFGGTTGDEVDKFARCQWTEGPGSVPLLAACPNRIVLERTSLHDDGGDHVCFVGEPVHADTSGELDPVRLSMAGDIEPGHEADDTQHRLEDVAAGAGHPIDLDEV